AGDQGDERVVPVERVVVGTGPWEAGQAVDADQRSRHGGLREAPADERGYGEVNGVAAEPGRLPGLDDQLGEGPLPHPAHGPTGPELAGAVEDDGPRLPRRLGLLLRHRTASTATAERTSSAAAAARGATRPRNRQRGGRLLQQLAQQRRARCETVDAQVPASRPP